MRQTTPSTRRPPPSTGDAFWDLVATAKHLQGPQGCAWDRAQTVQTLLPYLIEETWEVFDAIRSRRTRHLAEELGDVLYTVLFLALKAERRRWGTLDGLLRATRRKMIRRHPHVFGVKTAANPTAAYRQWQASKRLERKIAPSPSKAFRQRLVTHWEGLHEQQKTRRVPNESSRRPSATPRRWKGRSSSRR